MSLANFCFSELPPNAWGTLGEQLPTTDVMPLAACSRACMQKAYQYSVHDVSLTALKKDVDKALPSILAKWPQLQSIHLSSDQARAIHEAGLHSTVLPPQQRVLIANAAYSGPYHELPQFVAASLPVRGALRNVSLTGRFRDQGWGNVKGRFYAALMRCHGTLVVGDTQLQPLRAAAAAGGSGAAAGGVPAEATQPAATVEGAGAAAGDVPAEATQPAATVAGDTVQGNTTVGFVCVSGGEQGVWEWAQCSHQPVPQADASAALLQAARDSDARARELLQKKYSKGQRVSMWHSVGSIRLTGIAGHAMEAFQVHLRLRPAPVRAAEAEAFAAAKARGGAQPAEGEGHDSCQVLPLAERERLLNADKFLAAAQAGDVVQLHCIVGGGGGHELHWEDVQLRIDSTP